MASPKKAEVSCDSIFKNKSEKTAVGKKCEIK